MNNTKTWKVQTVVPADYPDEGKQYAYKSLKHKVGNELFGVLVQERNPAVVEIGELVIEPEPECFGLSYREKISIELKVTPVQYEDVVIQRSHFDWVALDEYKSVVTRLREWIGRRKLAIWR